MHFNSQKLKDFLPIILSIIYYIIDVKLHFIVMIASFLTEKLPLDLAISLILLKIQHPVLLQLNMIANLYLMKVKIVAKVLEKLDKSLQINPI